VSLVEKISKKANFLILASSLSPNKINVYNQSVESLDLQNIDVISARGFADLNKIFSLSFHLVRPKTRYLLLKGKKIEEEIKNALVNWSFEYIILESESSEYGYILEVKNLRKNAENNSNS
jgi:16S rRNA (guanine527-N7)-methyltransferase